MEGIERFSPSAGGQIAYEHLHRYAWCLSLVEGKEVLDVASGEGYGSALIARKAKAVVGVDINIDAITRASQIYRDRHNLRFIDADVTQLPFGAGEFDVVVSFETIEHLTEQSQMLDEIARVLKPDGLLIVSTPNRPVYSGPGRAPNIFHVKELDLPEFKALLAPRFAHIEIFGQRLSLNSLLTPVTENANRMERSSYVALTRGEGDGIEIRNSTVALPAPEYLIAVCSRRQLPKFKNANSVYLDPADDLWAEKEKVLRWASNLHTEDEELRRRFAALTREHEALKAEISSERRQRELLKAQLETSKEIEAIMATELRAMSGMMTEISARNAQIAASSHGIVTALERERAEAKDAGHRLAEREAELAVLRKKEELWSAKVAELTTEWGGMQRHLAERDAELLVLRREHSASLAAAGDLKAVLVDREKEVAALRTALQRRDAQNALLTTPAPDHSDRTRAGTARDGHLNGACFDNARTNAITRHDVKLPALFTEATPVGLPPPIDQDVLATWHGDESPRPWLSETQQDFWITQTLRDYVVDRHGIEKVGGIEQLMAMVADLDDNSIALEATDLGQSLIARVQAWASAIGEHPAPDVSIVIPVYNNLVYTLTAVLSILRAQSRYSYEIIVGDDRSTDGTDAVISTVGGPVRLVRHTRNKGFLGNCNTTAASARGRYIVLLNNDTITLPGWLDRLIGTFDQQAHVGLVGSKLLNGDGTLQEAGGIFWKDGSAWNFGRNQDPSLPQFNYVRDVDYCSGASIALPMEVWRKLGGFDRLYSPAYCEDSDMAFRVRAAGMRCVYQPRSELIHHEGRSHGTNTSTGIKAYQVLNQQKLVARWRHALERDHFANGENVFVARDRSHGKPHILFIDHYVPQRDRDAGSRTIYQYMKLFAERGFQVHLWPDNLHEDRDYVPELQALGIEVIYSAAYVDGFAQWFSENHKWIKYVFSTRPNITDRYVHEIKKLSGAKVLYYGQDLHWKRLRLQYDITKDTKLLADAENTKTLEDRVCMASDVLLYPSADECDYIRSAFPRARGVVEFPIYMFSDDEIEAAEKRIERIATTAGSSFLFVGGFRHTPNVDAVEWLANAVVPCLRARNSIARFLIVGSNVPDTISRLASPSMEILGSVDDDKLIKLHDQCIGAAIPLRFGAGVKGKTVDAMARGVPVIATSIGLQGINAPGDVAFLADDAEAFADAIDKATRDRSVAAAKARKALDFIRLHYSTEAAVNRLVPHVPELATISAASYSEHAR